VGHPSRPLEHVIPARDFFFVQVRLLSRKALAEAHGNANVIRYVGIEPMRRTYSTLDVSDCLFSGGLLVAVDLVASEGKPLVEPLSLAGAEPGAQPNFPSAVRDCVATGDTSVSHPHAERG
jgi:hypothetical protein